MLLAIDTSTETAGLALLRLDGTVQSELVWQAGRNHTAEMHPAMRDLLRRARLTVRDLAGIIVARGPGSFTGIRVGVSTAKGLALGLGVPIVGVETLEAAAYPFLWSGMPVWAVVDAGRGQVAAAAFRSDGDASDDGGFSWRKTREEAVLTPDELCDAIAGVQGESSTLLCGEVSDAVAARVQERLQGRALILPAVHRLRRPGYVAALGWRRLQQGDADDPVSLTPLYLRRPAAEEKRAG
jgi:tRNA threonylcarbamoyladenosine biosynthesis protein TsaB